MDSLQIHMFPCLNDNYGFLINDPASGQTASIDSPDEDAIDAALNAKGWRLDAIWNTHHHLDHVGGNLELKERWGCKIYGPKADRDRIPGIDVAVGEGDEVCLGAATARVMDTPGHTNGHVAYYFDEAGAVFVGDTLFSLGCGRLFEGTPAQMWDSLNKLMALPDATKIYCAHEYTAANAKFALTVDPDNADLVRRAAEVEALRAKGAPTVPTTLGEEKRTNPFLRAEADGLRGALGMEAAGAVEVFAETRARKDAF